jgi:hypothetical protein
MVPSLGRLLFLAGLCLAWPAAAEVYRWTDADGQVHYGSRPPPQGAQRLELPASAPPEGDADAARRLERQRRVLDDFEYQRAKKKEEAERAARQQQVDAARCRALQQRWRLLSHGGPVYFRDAGGERDYLDDERRAAEQARLRPAYVQACGREP